MAIQEKAIQTLIQLGLNRLQAEVYVALLSLGQATAKALSQHSKVARQEIYRILNELQKSGLVERIIAMPTKFKALPIEDCLGMLIKRKKEKLSEAEKKATALLQQLTENNSNNSNTVQESYFILVPEKEAYIRRVTNAIEITQTSCDMILHWECFRYGMIENTEMWKKSVKKGVNVRFIAYKSKDEKAVSRIVQALKNMGSFKVKYIFKPPPATIAIFDKKEICVTTSPTIYPQETPSLWSNNLGLTKILQEYFEAVWLTSNEDKYKKH